MVNRYLFLVLVGLVMTFCVHGAPGDTTWVQANIANLDGYGNYDSLTAFPAPGKTYRKIYMIFTLGKHTCTGSGYCGDWDYTVQNYLLVPGGDTLELGRFITPYANASAPRTPWTWQQHYVYDVTDYASLLHDNEYVRISYSGYSGGFTASIRFAFIEGTPERTVVDVKKLWGGSFGYGGTPDINTHFPALTEIAPAGTTTSTVKFTVTGHGSDANGCCEFAPHNYQVMLNSASVANKTIWRDNCGLNELSPQSGTWIYNRGNWCPGATVYSNFHDLPGIAAGSNYNVALQFDPYTGGGSYTTEATLIDYGPVNKMLDVSLDDIIAPTSDENHYRENPIAGSPIVRVRNTGSTAVTSIEFQYGLKDSFMYSYTWHGTLNSLQDSDIVLPEFYQLNEITGVSGMYTFVCKVLNANGATDADATNNSISSQFISAPRWPSTFKIMFMPNNEHRISDTTKSETSWIIYDKNNAIAAQRTDAKISVAYSDTGNLTPGLYRLALSDSSCDGLQWWVHANAGDGITGGFLFVRQLSNVNIPMHGYTYSGTYAHDFGCGFSQYFYIGTPVDRTGVNNISEMTAGIEAYPNPARGIVNIELSGVDNVNGTIQLIDGLGRVVSETRCNGVHQQLNVGSLANGPYTVVFFSTASGNKLATRLIIRN